MISQKFKVGVCMSFPIDFVVTWVDGSDEKWQRKRNEFSSSVGSNREGMNSIRAYREWGTFKFWFRAVEKYAPWVNHIYLVTDNQTPEWLDKDFPKLTLVDHKEIIDNTFLPTFNSNAIEANIYKIKNLTEHFVVFNDDMFITSEVSPYDFFDSHGRPKIRTSINPIVPMRYGTANFQVNDMKIINNYFTKKQIIKNAHLLSPKQGMRNLMRTVLFQNSKFFYGFWEEHMPYSLLKSTFQKLWAKESYILNRTSSHRFRSDLDTNIWLFKYWQLAAGETSVSSKSIGKLYGLADSKEVWNALNSNKHKIMCINDNVKENEEQIRIDFIDKLSKKYNSKSCFER